MLCKAGHASLKDTYPKLAQRCWEDFSARCWWSKPLERNPPLLTKNFVPPKLIWPKPPGKARWKTRVKNINERMALAEQGKWKTLLELSMTLPLPTYEPTPAEELLDEHGLSQEMARKLHAAACQGTGRQSMEADALSTPRQNHQGVFGKKLRTSSSLTMMLPLRRWMPKVGIPP